MKFAFTHSMASSVEPNLSRPALRMSSTALFEVRFEQRHDAILKLVEFLCIDLAAENVVPI
jgi:hypothetical protein